MNETSATTQPRKKLANAKQVAAASFLATSVMGAYFFYKTAKQLNRPDLAMQSILWGIGLLGLSLGISFVLPESFPGTPIILACQVLPMRELFRRQVEEAANAEIAGNRAVKESWGKVLGISIAVMLVLIAGVVGSLFSVGALDGL